MANDARTVVLIGGGRWGRVHASNLSQLLTPHDRVLWVSTYNEDMVRAGVAKFDGGPEFQVLTSLEEALSVKPVAALVVTSPETHADVAARCLRGGAHGFVEKPLAFKAAEARSLIDLAKTNGLVLGVGLHLLSASYLANFKKQISARQISRISIRWFDPSGEVRHGEAKKSDDKTPIVHDLYPHVWSIVSVLTGGNAQIGKSASEADGVTRLILSAGDVDVEALCDRNGQTRERRISIKFRDGGSASLDFTNEPGEAIRDGVALELDPHWEKSPRPVMAEVQEFLRQISLSVPHSRWPHLATNCIDCVTGAEILNAKLVS
jgi:predicted dehydrogenase